MNATELVVAAMLAQRHDMGVVEIAIRAELHASTVRRVLYDLHTDGKVSSRRIADSKVVWSLTDTGRDEIEALTGIPPTAPQPAPVPVAAEFPSPAEAIAELNAACTFACGWTIRPAVRPNGRVEWQVTGKARPVGPDGTPVKRGGRVFSGGIDTSSEVALVTGALACRAALANQRL